MLASANCPGLAAAVGSSASVRSPTMPSPFTLTEQQRRFFATFGYLALPGALRDDIGWICDEFELAWNQIPHRHDGSKHTGYPGVMAMGTQRLQTLFDHPVVVGALDALFGEGWSHYGGD